jgi:hypothetical protein
MSLIVGRAYKQLHYELHYMGGIPIHVKGFNKGNFFGSISGERTITLETG